MPRLRPAKQRGGNRLSLLTEDWPLAKIRPYPNNPRVLRNAAEKVAASIKAFGWRQPIVVDADTQP